MKHALRAAILLLTATLAACVTAYDPSVRDQVGLESQARQAGVERPIARAAKQPATSQATAKPIAHAPAASAASQPATPSSTPNTPAAQQLQWFLTLLNGAEIASPKAREAVESHFDPRFLAKVPITKLEDVTRSWRRDQFADGPCSLVKTSPGAAPRALTAFVRGDATARYTQIRLETGDDGKIVTLLLSPTTELAAKGVESWDALDAEFDRVIGPPKAPAKATRSLAFGAYRLVGDTAAPEPVALHEFGANHSLAVGSTFKLYILAALGEEAAAGRLKWSDPLRISDALKSIPSGTMQLEQEGAEFTIEQFAAKMISISDNTATDHLLARVGREKVEAVMARLHAHPALNQPMLSTMEMSKLKLGSDRALADRYAAADEPARRGMLAKGGEVTKQTASLALMAFWKAPYHIDIEWFASPMDLARVAAELRRLEQLPGNEPIARVLRINPGLDLGPAWSSIAYKGGSEPGVLSMTWLLQRASGPKDAENPGKNGWFVLTLTVNDTAKEIDQTAFIGLATSAAGLLANVP